MTAGGSGGQLWGCLWQPDGGGLCHCVLGVWILMLLKEVEQADGKDYGKQNSTEGSSLSNPSSFSNRCLICAVFPVACLLVSPSIMVYFGSQYSFPGVVCLNTSLQGSPPLQLAESSRPVCPYTEAVNIRFQALKFHVLVH